MRRLLTLLAVCGCASTNSEATAARQPPIYADKSGVVLGERPKPIATRVSAPPVAVWLAVKKVYADLAIPLTVDNPPAHQLGNNNFFRTGRLAGRPMIDFLDCGHGMSGANAATFRIFISLLSEVRADSGGGTSVLTTFVASAQDMSGSSIDRIPCGSTGRFETLFLDRVKAGVGPGG